MSWKELVRVWTGHREPERYSPEWRKQNDANIDAMVAEFGHEQYVTETRSDDYWRDCQARIEEMPESRRHDAYELLLSAIANNHERGYAAPIYDEIQEHANAHAVRK